MKFIRVIKSSNNKLAKSYWIWFFNGVSDLEDWANNDKVLLQYAKDHDIDSMAEYMIRDQKGINNTLELINELEANEIQEIKNLSKNII